MAVEKLDENISNERIEYRKNSNTVKINIVDYIEIITRLTKVETKIDHLEKKIDKRDIYLLAGFTILGALITIFKFLG